MTHIIFNNSHHLTITSNDYSKKLCIDRITSLQGAVYDGNGKCMQHDLGFRGYQMTIYGIKKCHEGEVSSKGFFRYENRLSWVTSDGQKYNIKRFNDKKKNEIINMLETFMKGQFTEAYKELTKK